MATKARTVAVLQFIVLRTSRTESVLAFYRALGLAFAVEKHGRGPRHHACDLGGLVLEIYPRGAGETDAVQDGMIIGLRIPSIEDALAALAAAGFRPPLGASPPGAGRPLAANVTDPDGRKVILSAG